jgi:hypothetical protein
MFNLPLFITTGILLHETRVSSSPRPAFPVYPKPASTNTLAELEAENSRKREELHQKVGTRPAKPVLFDEPWEGRWVITNDGQLLMIALDADLTEEQEWDLKLTVAKARARLWEGV